MGALIVYESMYGNTRAIAEVIAEGWGDGASVTSVREAGVPPDGTEVLVVGGPTHMHGMSSALSRRLAISAGLEDGHQEIDPDAVDAPGLRRWLRDLPRTRDSKAAAFDTRLDRAPGLTGSAARGIARRLRDRAYRVDLIESFLVDDAEGPLSHGELERARAWGATLRQTAQGPADG